MTRTALVAELERTRAARLAAIRVSTVQRRQEREVVRRCRAGGMSLAEIAKVLGVTRSYVQALAKVRVDS